MKLDKVLKEAQERPISKEEAVFLFENVSGASAVLRLLGAASRVRDLTVGRLVRLDGFLGGITPCSINPPCFYCTRALKHVPDKFQRNGLLTLEEVALGAKAIAATGTTTVELGGGTSFEGARIIKEAVKVVREEAPQLEIWVNVGPSLNQEDVRELKELGVDGITSSFETMNEEIFRRFKPGDSLAKRIELARIIDGVGVNLHSVLMVGLGESYKDRVDHMFFLKQIPNLRMFLVTWLHISPGSPIQNHPEPTPLEAAKTAAIARLIFRVIDIHVSGWEYLTLWLMAGANRFVHAGAGVHKHQRMIGRPAPLGAEKKMLNGEVDLTNLLPVTTRYVEELGLRSNLPSERCRGCLNNSCFRA